MRLKDSSLSIYYPRVGRPPESVNYEDVKQEETYIQKRGTIADYMLKCGIIGYNLNSEREKAGTV